MRRSHARLALGVTAALVTAGTAEASSLPHGPLPSPGGQSRPSAPAGEDMLGWEQLDPATFPPGRDQAAAAYDAGIERVVVFSGHTYGDELRDTWLFDGSVWTELDLQRQPPARYQSAMVYDAAREEIVLYGGRSGGTSAFGDTWVFDGSRWQQRLPATSPPALTAVAMAYDARNKVVVLFGGERSDGGFSDQTWVWDGATWTRRDPELSPPATASHAMAYSRQRHAVVALGGEAEVSLRETWVWDGEGWQQLEGRSPGRGRWSPGLAPWHRRVVLYGGPASTSDPQATMTWVLGETRWHRRARGTDAGAMLGPALVYDEAREQVVLFGGWRPDEHLDNTWVLETIS